jgi:hypothetical protein
MGHPKMPLRVKSFLVAAVALVVGAAYLLQPWAEIVALVTVAAIAPFATAFAALYFWTVPWWQTLIGRAMLASSAGLALLVDISLLYQWLGDNYQQRDIVRLAVFFTVLIGAVFKLQALALEKYRARRDHRADRLS